MTNSISAVILIVFSALGLTTSQIAVNLRSMDHVQAGPTPDSFVYIEGQNMTFVCNATPSSQSLQWLVELTGQTGPSLTITLANAQPRIETGVATNNVNPSSITVLNAMLGDSNTTVTCKDGVVGNTTDVVTMYVEGLPPCPRVTLNGTTDSTLSLSWVPTGLLSTLQYQITTDPAIDGVNGTENTTNTSYTFTGLQPLTEYNISIAACNVVGCSSSCGVVYTTGPMWEDDFVSVCSNGGSNPGVTVFVQYMSDMNSSASEFVVSISGQSRTKRVPITGDGEYSAYFDGVTLGNMYTVTVQPFNGSSAGNMVTRQISVQAVVSVSTSTNHTFSCMDTCVGPLSVSSCQTTVTCGTNSTYYLTTSVGSSNSTSVPDCTICSASTVVQLGAGQQNFTQSDSLTVIGSNCDAGPTVTAATSLPAYAVALIVIGAILVGIGILLIIAGVIFLVFRFCNKDEKPKTFKDEEMKNVESGENNNNNNNYEAVEEVSQKPEEPTPEVKYSQVNKQPEQDKLVYADLQFAEQSVSQNPPPQKDVVVYSEITKNEDDVRVVEGTGDDTVADDN